MDYRRKRAGLRLTCQSSPTRHVQMKGRSLCFGPPFFPLCYRVAFWSPTIDCERCRLACKHVVSRPSEQATLNVLNGWKSGHAAPPDTMLNATGDPFRFLMNSGNLVALIKQLPC